MAASYAARSHQTANFEDRGFAAQRRMACRFRGSQWQHLACHVSQLAEGVAALAQDRAPR